MKNIMTVLFCLLPIIIMITGFLIDNTPLRISLLIIWVPITILATKIMEDSLKK